MTKNILSILLFLSVGFMAWKKSTTKVQTTQEKLVVVYKKTY